MGRYPPQSVHRLLLSRPTSAYRRLYQVMAGISSGKPPTRPRHYLYWIFLALTFLLVSKPKGSRYCTTSAKSHRLHPFLPLGQSHLKAGYKRSVIENTKNLLFPSFTLQCRYRGKMHALNWAFVALVLAGLYLINRIYGRLILEVGEAVCHSFLKTNSAS